MRISLTDKTLPETYVVKFWYKRKDGFLSQMEDIVYSGSKNAHKQVEKFWMKHQSKLYEKLSIISVTYE